MTFQADGDSFGFAIRTLNSGRPCIVVEGELDLSNADELTDALRRELSAGHLVLLDLSGVTFIDSTGLAAIINALNSTRESRAELELCSDLRPQPRRLMELTGVLSVLPLVDARAADLDGAST
jgi:anti-sigma B factor antagonist